MSESKAPPPSSADRRVYVRHPGTPETPTYAVSEQEDIITWKARVRDLSVGGVSLLLNSGFPIGATVEIDFRNDATRTTRTLDARIVRSDCKDDIHWVIGCEFLQKLSEEEMNALL